MADTPFLQLSERWRLAYDRHQWIAQRRSGSDGKGKGERWRSVFFIESKRSTVVRYLKEYGAVVGNWAAVESLPSTFREWQRMRAEAANKATASAEAGPEASVCGAPRQDQARRRR